MRELKFGEAPQPAQVLVGHKGKDQASTRITWPQSQCFQQLLYSKWPPYTGH